MDVKPFAEYFRFHAPREYEGQTVWTPFTGEVTDGCIYVATNEMQASVLRAHSDWEAVSKSEYDAQGKPAKALRAKKADEPSAAPSTDESPSADAQTQTDTKEKPDEE